MLSTVLIIPFLDFIIAVCQCLSRFFIDAGDNKHRRGCVVFFESGPDAVAIIIDCGDAHNLLLSAASVLCRGNSEA